MLRKLLIITTLVASLALAGCSSTGERITNALPEINLPEWEIPGVYKIPIQQGNLITQEMVNELKPGMTKQQVRYLLGTPLLVDTFRDDHWEYLYTHRPGNQSISVETEKNRLELHFNNSRLHRIAGDMYPQGKELALITKGKNRERTVIIPADAPRYSERDGFFDTLVDKATSIVKDDPVIKNETPEQPADQ